MEELWVFGKDPGTLGMLTLPPLLQTNVYVHHAVDIVFNLAATVTLVPRAAGPIEERACHARTYTRVFLLGNNFRKHNRPQQINCNLS